MDLVTSAILASTYSIGIAFAAPVLFCWQGAIYLAAGILSSFFTDTLMCEISLIGGFLITSSGLGIRKMKELKTLNMLPALLIPPIFFILKDFFNK